MFAWIVGLSIVSLYLILSYNKCMNRIDSKDREILRLNEALSEIRNKIHLLEENKASISRTKHLTDQIAKKADKDQFEVAQRSIKEIERVVFENESFNDSVKRSERIHLD